MAEPSAFEPEGGWGSTPEQVVRRWSELGTELDVPGARTRVWRSGHGEPVVLLHGVPASAFLYRKVISPLARHGLEAIAFDFPGLGLAERPTGLDLSWSALAGWTLAAIDALGLDRFHLVVHDIGGPIGFEVIRRAPGRIRSLVVLDTLVRVASFRKPWVMRLYLRTINPWTMERLMRLQGVLSPVPAPELRAYALLLKLQDGGAAFLRMMRSFETTADMEARVVKTLRERRFPARVLWGARDPALGIRHYGELAREAVGVARVEPLPGKHFVQEDAPQQIADAVADLSREAIARPRGGS
jgi:haloalkane dehalogenase